MAVEGHKKRFNIREQMSLRNVIWISFTLATTLATIIMGIAFYSLFSSQYSKQRREERQLLMTQINSSVVSYLRNMMKVSDTLAFSVIKDQDIQTHDFSEKFQILYDSNSTYIKNIALFTEDGKAIAMAPAAIVKENINLVGQDWFSEALSKSENMHFYDPHVQNLFVEHENNYEWVISLSRAVQITDGIEIKRGVLLIDLQYSGLEQLLESAAIGDDGYLYIVDRMGEIVYHPFKQTLTEAEKTECKNIIYNQKSGNYTQQSDGIQQDVTIKTVGYTGWLMASVTSQGSFSLGTPKGRLLVITLFLFFATALVMLNSLVSSLVSKPFQKLELALKKIEKGDMDVKLNITGAYEVRHLGKTIQKMAAQIKRLMEDIVREHEAKRKSELDSLQAQINPHFLYNTLDIIVWMIENERQSDASKVVTSLARFFRISLSKGNRIITVKDEIEHVNNYLAIQNMRYKNRFKYTVEIEEAVEELAVIKLILQPLVENAIYHGVEFMDGDGEIRIRAYSSKDELYLSVKDNGLGMTEDTVQKLLDGEIQPSGKGSGTGVVNVNQRIQLYFGEQYGLQIYSEPDEGTEMRIHLPLVKYQDIKEEQR